MADLDLTPARWNWASVVTGDTYPAANLKIDGADSTLARVQIQFKPCAGGDASLTLDSNNATITINDAATWDFTINRIAAVSLDAGIYAYDMQTTAADGTIRTETSGTWTILPEVTS